MSQDYQDSSQHQDPLVQAPAGHPVEQGDATGGIIPYKNGPALMAYYLGIFSLIPCLGLVLAIPAFVLGIMGLKKRNQNPAVKGTCHAWIGIIMGGLFTLIWGGVLVFVIIAQLDN
ncbi:MAG: hypothetical protein VX311_17170 [Planctomycetota bacterium]|nr:hypothetical protein [Planctomycetota bacterium]